MRVGYVRVSTADQSTDRQQLDGCEKVFVEKASGGTADRPVLKQMMDFVREGDTVEVWSIDRLARNLADLQAIVSTLNAKGVGVSFISEKLTFNANDDDPLARLSLHLMASFAEFERAIIRKRQYEGIQRAKAKGVYKGRKPSIDKNEIVRLKGDGLSVSAIARKLNVCRASVYRAFQ